MTCAIMQPTFFPWIGYFDMIDQVDTFIFLDDIQLVKSSWQVRNRIKVNRQEHYINVPVKKTASFDETMINTAVVDPSPVWRNKIVKTLYMNYKKSRHFDDVYSFIETRLFHSYSSLGDLNASIIKDIALAIGMKDNFVSSHNLQGVTGKKDSLVASLCQAVASKSYLAAPGSAEYIEKETPGGEIVKSGVDLFYHQYDHPTYEQLQEPFIPYLSSVDLLFNHGFEGALAVIRRGRKPPQHYLAYREEHNLDLDTL